MVGALTTLWLWVLGVPSAAFCWMVWAILGQASGAYVGPACWAVLFLAGAAAVLHQRPAHQKDLRRRRGFARRLGRRTHPDELPGCVGAGFHELPDDGQAQDVVRFQG